MNSTVYLRALTDPSIAPCLALLDLQEEYVANARLMAMPDVGAILENCKAALYHARSMGFPVAFFRQVSRSTFFNPVTIFSGWIKGFEPSGADMIFDRDKPSCYSNQSFARLMDSCGGNFIIAGLAGETACLSTAVDAYHRNHRFVYLSDASASHRLGRLSASSVQEAVTAIIGVYGDVRDTISWINATSDVVAIAEGGADAR
jgi:nicotinamidase-related amidase